jgi:hypothetical protein
VRRVDGEDQKELKKAHQSLYIFMKDKSRYILYRKDELTGGIVEAIG